jgi:hypothetical protein
MILNNDGLCYELNVMNKKNRGSGKKSDVLFELKYHQTRLLTIHQIQVCGCYFKKPLASPLCYYFYSHCRGFYN